MAQNLAQAKETIWIEINDAMSEIWPSIQIIFEQQELINKSKETVAEIKVDLGW